MPFPPKLESFARCLTLEQAAPLQEWTLPAAFERLRRLLETRMDKRGRKEYIQILRLLEIFSIGQVDHAIGQAHHLGVPSFDAITHSVLGSERLTGALLDRLTHHVHILQMNDKSYRLATSKKR